MNPSQLIGSKQHHNIKFNIPLWGMSRRHYKTSTNGQVHINTDKWLMEQGADPIEIIQTKYIQGFARAIKRLSRPEKEYLPALKATMW